MSPMLVVRRTTVLVGLSRSEMLGKGELPKRVRHASGSRWHGAWSREVRTTEPPRLASEARSGMCETPETWARPAGKKGPGMQSKCTPGIDREAGFMGDGTRRRGG